jgi:hypothetical protein
MLLVQVDPLAQPVVDGELGELRRMIRREGWRRKKPEEFPRLYDMFLA